MKKIRISKHEDISTQNWYGTKLDSSMLFPDTWFDIDKNIVNKFFHRGNNGGSYSLNFDSNDLDAILSALNLNENMVEYEQDITPENGMRKTHSTNKELFIAYKVSNNRDFYTDYLTPYFASM
jgi:hypothetical protein